MKDAENIDKIKTKQEENDEVFNDFKNTSQKLNLTLITYLNRTLTTYQNRTTAKKFTTPTNDW